MKSRTIVHFRNGIGNFVSFTPALQALASMDTSGKVDMCIEKDWMDSRKGGLFELWDSYPFINKTISFDEIVQKGKDYKTWFWSSCFIHPLLGLPVAALVYLMFPLPAWFSWGRFWMEYNADTVLFKHLASIGEKNMLVDYAPQRIAALSGPEYLWAVSFNYAKKRYDKLLASL